MDTACQRVRFDEPVPDIFFHTERIIIAGSAAAYRNMARFCVGQAASRRAAAAQPFRNRP